MNDNYAIKINDMPFTPLAGVHYKHNYVELAQVKGKTNEWNKYIDLGKDSHLISSLTPEDIEKLIYKKLVLTDLFFIVYFVLRINVANHPFVVKMCKEVETGPQTMTLDIWSRGHFKTSIITLAETVQYHLKYPDRCSILFAYKKGLSMAFLSSIMRAYEGQFLISLFPDRLFANPFNDSPLWSVEKGINIIRLNQARTTPTISASGLIEGMSQGLHAERHVYDDTETFDMVDSPNLLTDCYYKYKMALYMEAKTNYDSRRVLGTYHSHLGPMKRITDEKDESGKPMYYHRIIPCTEDGTFHGKPVYWTEKILQEEKKNKFYPMQGLCNPTPIETRILNDKYLNIIERHEVPKNILKWLLIDWAGDSELNNETGCLWAFGVIGVDFNDKDEIGNNNIYITDLIIDNFKSTDAIEEIVRMYLRNGILQAVGVEKNAMGLLEYHIVTELKNKGRVLSKDRGNLIILNPGQRKKDSRIEQITWPLNNNKLHIVKDIAPVYLDEFIEEMKTFPYGRKDGLDMLAYTFDILKDPKLSRFRNNVYEIKFQPHEYKMQTHVA